MITVEKSRKIHALINLLVNQDGYITVNSLAKQLNVSPRTVHNYLNSSEFISLIRNNEIEKTPNAGIKLNLESTRKLKVLSSIKNQSLIPVSPNNFDDFTFILIKLFTEKDYLSFSFLEESLYKSPSSIQTIIQEVDTFISKFSCHLIYRRKRGVKLIGEENDIRSLFLFVTTNYINSKKESSHSYRISEKTDSVLDTFLTEKEKETIIQLAVICETTMNTSICENDYNLLLLYLMIIVLRVRNQFYSAEKSDETIQKSTEFQYATLLKIHIEQSFQIYFPESELYYLARILMSTRKQTNVITGYNESKVIDRFISLVSMRLNMDLTRDKELSLNLNTHLRPAIIRMKQGIPFSNPLLEHIKNDYTEVYLSVLTAIDDLEAMENIFFDANEIGYICLHIIAAINRPENVSSIKTALVCNEGLSIELFLTQIIESYFKEIKIVEVYRSNNIKELVPDSFDLVINTTNTKITSPNVIKSSTSFTQSDYSVIKHFIYFHAFDSKLVNYSLNNHLMYFRDSLSSQEELLSKYCTYLHSIGFVTPKFLETVLERQQKSTTYVARGIAVPHGSKDEVLRSAVLIINLDEGIEWDGNQVRTVIFIVANDEGSAEFSQLLRRIMRVASSDQLTINLHACNTITDFYEVINSPGVGSF